VFRMFSLGQHDFYNLNPGQSEWHKPSGSQAGLTGIGIQP
jgi:hypothetical protein